jgi:hypothetical protein
MQPGDLSQVYLYEDLEMTFGADADFEVSLPDIDGAITPVQNVYARNGGKWITRHFGLHSSGQGIEIGLKCINGRLALRQFSLGCRIESRHMAAPLALPLIADGTAAGDGLYTAGGSR